MFEHSLKKAYLWYGAPYTPDSDTLAYWKFDWDLKDSSWKWYNLTSSGAWSFTYWTTSWWGKYVQTNYRAYSNEISNFPFNSAHWTVSFWMSFTNNTKWYWGTQSSYTYTWATVFDLMNTSNWWTLVRPTLSWMSSWWSWWQYWFNFLNIQANTNRYQPSTSDTWHYYTLTLNSWTAKLYRDWSLVSTDSYTAGSSFKFILNTVTWWSSYYNNYSSVDKLSELIIDNKVWSESNISDFYNYTKNLYQ